MGINIYAKRSDYPSRCKWYKAQFIDHGKLKPDAKCNGVFYCKDIVQYSEVFDNSFGVTGNLIRSVTIETPDNVFGIEINDYVLYEGNLYRIATIPESDDLGKNKFYSNRPHTITKLELRR